MCLGELARVTGIAGTAAPVRVDVVDARTGRRSGAVSLVDGLEVGDHVIVHAGHVVQRVTAEAFVDAAGLRASTVPAPTERP